MATKPPGKEKFEAPLIGSSKNTGPPSSRVLYLVMALVAVAILVGGYLFYHFQEQQMLQRVEDGLSIMAQLKSEQIAEWRAARLVDVNTLAGSPSFTDTVGKYIASPTDMGIRDKVLADLAIVAQSYPYQDILLTDVNGKVLLNLNDSVPRLGDVTLAQLPVAIKEHKAVMTDFHYASDGDSPQLDVIAPLFPWGQDLPQAIGAVVFYIDPAQYLYPMLQSSPTTSETAETLMVERDGDQVLFLNELRHQKDTALKLRIPLSQQEVPAVMAVMGKEGVFEGRDYRGVEVLSALKQIPDSTWYMVAKIDTSEALSAWHTRAGFIIASVAGLLAAELAGIGVIWQRRQRKTYQKLYQAELKLRESQDTFKALIENSQDAITMLAADGTVLYDSPSIVRILGYTPEERFGRSVFDFVHPDQRQNMTDGFIKFTQQPGAVARSEVPFLHKDGTLRWIEGMRSNLLYEPGIGAVVVNYRNITERKQAEEALRENEEKYRSLVETGGAGVASIDLEGNITFVNQSLREQLGYSEKEIVGKNFASFLHPDDSERVMNAFMEGIANPDLKPELEFRLIGKDGHSIWYYTAPTSVIASGTLSGASTILVNITERKQAEEALRRSEEKYRTLFEQSIDSVFITTREGRVLDANQSTLNLFGYTRKELIGMDVRKMYFNPKDRLNFQQKIEQKGFVKDRHIKLRKKDGAEVECLLTAVVWHSDDKNLLGYQGILRDITERERVEEALRTSEVRYRLLVENANEAIVVAQDGMLKFANPKAAELSGYSIEELTSMSFTDIIYPDDRDMVVERHLHRLQDEVLPQIYPFRIIDKAGDIKWAEINAVSLIWDGKPATLDFLTDITERKRAEEAQRRSEERYRSIVEEMDESYYETDLAGNLTFVNDATCRRLGRPREELIGMKYKAYTPEEDHETVFKIYNRVYRTGESVKGAPAVAIAKDGSLRFVERSVFPLRDREGKIIGFRGISRDVTDRRKAEEERIQLEQKAQISSRLASVGEMAAGVAHEINNPLTAVTGYAQLLVGREDIPSDIRSDLEAINDGARRVAGIVQRLLAFSRQTKPQRKLVDINELIESTLVLRAYHLRVNNIEVITRLYPDLLETVVDPGQIQQVLLNLIVNAETEMKLAHGKGKLTITTRKTNNTIKIYVKDDGPGIKPEVMNRIFDPFFTTREVGQGTGLGLSLCYGIITEHKGKIYAENKTGKGAAFIVELPVVTEGKPPKPAEPVVKKSKKAVKARILVVDDEQVVRDVINRVLTGEGHKVETIDNAAEALKKIESQRYKLILVDIKMPGMNGVELYKRIQKINKSLARRVAFITGDVMGADTEKFLSETKVAYIEKPFNAEQLNREVNRALSAGG